jgi:hypothetical protein
LNDGEDYEQLISKKDQDSSYQGSDTCDKPVICYAPSLYQSFCAPHVSLLFNCQVMKMTITRQVATVLDEYMAYPYLVHPPYSTIEVSVSVYVQITSSKL